MSQKSALMEWIYQTRKIAKMVDYTAIDLIDSIRRVCQFVDKKVLENNKEFFDYYCNGYNKPDLIQMANKFKRSTDKKKSLSKFVSESIERIKKQEKEVENQWFEIIDFMYERPEMVNPSIVEDDYISRQFERFCANGKKNNPLKNGITKRFGKQYRDKKGKWRPERRKRF